MKPAAEAEEYGYPGGFAEADHLKLGRNFDKGKAIERWRRKVTGLTGREPYDGGTAEIQSHGGLPRSRKQ